MSCAERPATGSRGGEATCNGRQDSLDRIVPEGRQYRHLDEGMDDMPAHVKSSLMGASLTVPIQQGRLALGTWQVRTSL